MSTIGRTAAIFITVLAGLSSINLFKWFAYHPFPTTGQTSDDLVAMSNRLFHMMEESKFAIFVKTDTEPTFWLLLHRPEDDTPRAPILYKRHYYETHKTVQMKELLQEGIGTLGKGIFVDVGANVGWFSLWAAALGRHVVAFEPNPDNLRLLRMSIEINHFHGKISVQPFGAGSVDHELTFLKVATNQGMGHFVSGNDTQADAATRVSIEHSQTKVRVKRVDDVLKTLVGTLWQQPIVLVKIDVEGFEHEVLTGLLSTLARDRPALMLEFDNKVQSDDYYDAIFRFISIGYRCGGLSVGMNSSDVQKWFQANILPSKHPVDVFCPQAGRGT